MPKIIGFYGNTPADLCMYTAYAMQNTGKRICVIDNSKDGSLFHCIPTPDKQLTAVTSRSVDFIRWYPLVQWHELDYDYIFVQLGTMPQQLCLALCSERILVTDCERTNLDAYSRHMQQCSMPATVLLRGFSRDWLRTEQIIQQIKSYLADSGNLIEQWLFLPYDPADEAYRIKMQYGVLSQFSHISKSMEQVLMKLMQMLETRDRVQIARAITDAKHGKIAAAADTRNIAG